MKSHKTIRTLSVIASAALIVGAFAVGPADAKKKKKKPPVPAACAAYTPGEAGAEAETSVVTDAATAEAPVVVELEAGAGFTSLSFQGQGYDETTSVFHNIQVDTANPTAGLYAKVEFTSMHDYDFYMTYAEGGTAASSGDFQVLPGEGIGSGEPDGGWEAGNDYESVLGIITPDCAGYTAEIVSFLTNGGPVTLSLWLGEEVVEPTPPS